MPRSDTYLLSMNPDILYKFPSRERKWQKNDDAMKDFVNFETNGAMFSSVASRWLFVMGLNKRVVAVSDEGSFLFDFH